MLKIEIEEAGSQTNVILEGKLDSITVGEFESILAEIPKSVKHIDINMEKVSSISSMGLRVLLQFHNQINEDGRKLTVSHPREIVNEVFEVTGMSAYIDIIP
ncbi:MAG: STAS domain-containing protein [Lachnospiraceae bacterium]|nr:STAS domain-containing protein [Lachnospiraceae bacterium]